MDKYLTVKNWNQFQQYKDRDPKWIKLHRDILNDYEFDQLTEVQQNHLMKIWLLASKLDNKIPHDAAWIAKQIGAKSKVDIKQFVTYGFLLVYENVQDCTETYLETEKRRDREETETDKETEIPAFINAGVWSDFVTHRKEKRSPLKPTTVKQIVKDLTKWNAEGDDANDILVTSIRNGWTGIFKPSAKKKTPTNGSSVEYVADDQLETWAIRNGAPRPKHQIGYDYTKYRSDLIQWENSR